MEQFTSIFLFYYYAELWRCARERERLEAEHTSEVSGVFERVSARDPGSAADRPDVRPRKELGR